MADEQSAAKLAWDGHRKFRELPFAPGDSLNKDVAAVNGEFELSWWKEFYHSCRYSIRAILHTITNMYLFCNFLLKLREFVRATKHRRGKDFNPLLPLLGGRACFGSVLHHEDPVFRKNNP